MIGTVTLNPCVDRTCHLGGFSYGGMNRIIDDRRDYSGKGINVSLALLQNGSAVRTGGFFFQEGGAAFQEGLLRQGISYKSIKVPGRLRENIKLWNSEDGVTTEVNQSGAFVSMEKWKEFKDFFSEFLEGLSLVVLTGSVPKGIPHDAYRQLIEIAYVHHVPVILDAEGDLLSEGLQGRPLAIKPNAFEFAKTFGVPEHAPLGVLAGKARQLIGAGMVSIVCITLGSEGAMIIDKNGGWRTIPIPLEVKATQGAGDSVVAGMCMAWEAHLATSDMLRYGVAMADGTITREGTLMCRKEDFQRFLPLVRVEALSL